MSEAVNEKPRSGDWLRRAAVLALGLFIALLLLEGALRVIGHFHVEESRKRGGKVAQGTTRILCFGDSFTFGVGAASGEDYPSQLERMLNERAGGKRFSVINRGVGGYNTSQVLSELRTSMDVVKPQMVIVMTGIHNPWNLWGYNEYKKGDTFWARAEKLLYRVRVFKLVILLAQNIKHKKQGIKGFRRGPTKPPEPEPTQDEPARDEPAKQEPAKQEPAPAPEEKPEPKKKAGEHGGNGSGDDDEEHGGNGNGDDDDDEGGNGDPDGEGDKDDDMGYASLVDTAIIRLERLAETDATFKTVMAHLRKNRFKPAAAWLEARMVKEPKNGLYPFTLGAMAHKQKKPDAARAWFKKGMAADPQEVDNYCGMANTYWEERKYDDAIRWYSEAIKVAPRDPGNYSQIGRLHLDKNDQDGALKWFKKGIEVGKDPANYLGIVDILLLRNKHAEARTWLQRAIKDDPNHSELFNRMGIVSVHLKKYREAIKYFEKGIVANPRDIANYEELCKVLRDTKIPASTSVLKKLREAARTNKIVQNYITFLKRRGGGDFNAEALTWAKHDLRQMHRLCTERGVHFVIQSYPEPAIELKAFAAGLGALYVDNERVFTRLLVSGARKETYFVPDGHCNARGYGVVAKNILEVMVKKKLFGLK